MTTTPAMPDLPEPELGYIETDKSRQPAFSARQMRAAMQAQPAEVSDEDIYAVWTQHCQTPGTTTRQLVCAFARAILALRQQSESDAPTVEAAREMGAKGGPVVKAERLAFEAWMAGHCWKVSPTWNGQTYDDSEWNKARKLLDPLARTTRMLWAAWRDRAALNTRPQAVPMTEEVKVASYSEWRRGDVLRITREGNDIGPFEVGQLVRHDDEDGDNVPYCRSLNGDYRYALIHDQLEFVSAEAHHGITAPAGGEGK